MKNSLLPEFQGFLLSAPLFLQEVHLFILPARKKRVFLGDKGFIEECKRNLDASTDLQEIPRLQRYAERPVLAELLHEEKRRDEDQRNRAIYHAHVTYGYTLKEIADLYYDQQSFERRG